MLDTAPTVSAILDRLMPAPFWDHLGAELCAVSSGAATVRVRSRAEFGRSSNTGDGAIHGGLVATLIDMTASCAVLTLLAPDERRTTVVLNVHYLAPAIGDLTAVATVRRRGHRTAVIDVEVASTDGALVALGRAVFAIQGTRG
jgi:uncharacterized protein (TIGR00369 family)